MKWPVAMLLGAAVAMAAPRPLTLEEAQALALKQNRMLKLARLKVDEAAYKRAAARTDYFPRALADSNLLYFNRKLSTDITTSGLNLGVLLPPLPPITVPLTVVKQTLSLSTITVGQPVTQLLKVREGVRVADTEVDAARVQTEKGEHEIRFAVEQLYYGALIAGRKLRAAEQKVAAAEELLRDAANAVETGNTLEVSAIGRRAALLEARQAVMAARAEYADYTEALNTLAGLPVATELQLSEPPRPNFTIATPEDAVATAMRESPEVREAEITVSKARAGVKVAQLDYVPDVTAFVQGIHQEGMPSMPGTFAAVGGRVSYTLFDFGKRRQQVKERETQLAQAQENVRRVREKLEADVRKSYRAVERSLQMVDVAREALALRKEGERLNNDQFELGLAVKSAMLESRAARASAEADLLRAEAGWRLSLADLKRVAGIKP